MTGSAKQHSAAKRPLARLPQWGLRSLNALRGSHGRRGALALVDQLMVGGTNFLTILLLGRLAGPHDLGVFALVMTVNYLLLSVQESLFTSPYTIFIVQLKGVRQRQYSGATLCQSAAWSACVGAVLATVAFSLIVFGKESSLTGVIAAFALVAPLWLTREFARRYLFARMQVAKVVTMSVVGSVAQFIVLCLLAYCGRLSAATAILAMGVGSAISGGGCLWLNRADFQLDRQRWLYFARKNWVMGRWLLASQVMGVLAQNTMPWLVWIWLGPSATGLFAACDAIIRFASPIIVSLNNVFTPRIALGFQDGGKAELNRIVWKATALLTLFLFAFCVVLAIAGEWLLNRSFGKTYAGDWATLVVLGINQLVGKSGLGLAPSGALWVLERANIIVLAVGANLAATLLVAPLLVHEYASLGAALALLIGSLVYSAVAVVSYRALIRDRKEKHFLSVGSAVSSATSTGSVME